MVRHCVVVRLMVSVCLFKRICIELYFLLHLHCMGTLHQVNKGSVNISVLAHCESQIERFWVCLMTHKDVKERAIQVAVVQMVVR